MANYVIVGAGAAGLYTAYRLLTGGTLQSEDTVQLYEWSQRPGGRIFTYTFPDEVGGNGLYCEFGGMRFATDQNFPTQITEGHVLVQDTIVKLGLAEKVVPFTQSSNRLYYLRGTNVYENDITSLEPLPYGFSSEFKQWIGTMKPPYTADNILGEIATLFAPGLTTSNADRAKWCAYFASGEVPQAQGTPAFPAGTPIETIGYWNLLYDQFGDEGFDYTADGTGYTSNVINWNSADAMQANNDYGSTTNYSRLDGGYSLLFEALASQIAAAAANYPGSGIAYGAQLTSLVESTTDDTTTCTFAAGDGSTYTVTADYLFLAMPRRALEMVATGSPETSMLNRQDVRYWLESSIDQPAIKVVMVFDEAWWAGPNCAYPPNLLPTTVPPAQRVGGDTITDLPLRMIYYFGNNVPGGPGTTGGPYVLLASYDDMTYSNFWRELEIVGDWQQTPSSVCQPLHGPTSVDPGGPFAQILRKQLADCHGIPLQDIPQPTALYFQDWGQDPFGAGYHGWAPHFNICKAMDSIRAPYQKILGDQNRKTYIIGSCYSFDQAWVEGAFCVAESVLQDFCGLPPFNPNLTGYTLMCSPSD